MTNKRPCRLVLDSTEFEKGVQTCLKQIAKLERAVAFVAPKNWEISFPEEKKKRSGVLRARLRYVGAPSER